MVQKFRVGLALQPVATALFAASPFFEGRVNGWQSWRARDLAGHRPGADRHAALRLRGRHGLRALRRLRARRADVLRLPRRPLHRRARPVVPRLPRRAAAGAARREADALGLGRPSDDDLPRGAASSASWRCAAPTAGRGGGSARCRRSGSGCSTTAASLDAAWDLCRDWTAEERDRLRHDAGKHGLRAEIRGRSLRELAGEVLAIAEAGLKARARPGRRRHDRRRDALPERAARDRRAPGRPRPTRCSAGSPAPGKATSRASTPTTATEPIGRVPRPTL